MTPLKNVPIPSSADQAVAVLAVSPDRRYHSQLQQIFSHSNWKIFGVGSCAEACRFLQQSRIGVVLSDSTLPDGTWKDLLRQLRGMPGPPLLVVSAEDSDVVFWAEVLNLGAYDVLSKPLDHMEVVRIVSLAWLHWKNLLSEHEAHRMDTGSYPVSTQF